MILWIKSTTLHVQTNPSAAESMQIEQAALLDHQIWLVYHPRLSCLLCPQLSHVHTGPRMKNASDDSTAQRTIEEEKKFSLVSAVLRILRACGNLTLASLMFSWMTFFADAQMDACNKRLSYHYFVQCCGATRIRLHASIWVVFQL